MMLFVEQEDGVDAAVVFRVVGHLGVLAPDDLSSGRDQTQLTDVDLDYRSLCDYTLKHKLDNFYFKHNFIKCEYSLLND
jgi:hypothetical protein